VLFKISDSNNRHTAGMDRRIILVLKSNGVNVPLINTNITVFFGIDDQTNYVYKNLKDVDSFIIYTSDRYISQLLKSGILDIKQVKCIVLYCDSLNNIEQVRYLCRNISSKFDFCLKTEVENRIKNDIASDLLNSSRPLDRNHLLTTCEEKKQKLQMKQQDLESNGSCISSRPIVGFDAKNKNIIDWAFLCRICSLILRDPVQLSCGHRQCKSCVESKIEG
jgi:hypothetical protein